MKTWTAPKAVAEQFIPTDYIATCHVFKFPCSNIPSKEAKLEDGTFANGKVEIDGVTYYIRHNPGSCNVIVECQRDELSDVLVSPFGETVTYNAFQGAEDQTITTSVVAFKDENGVIHVAPTPKGQADFFQFKQQS